MSLRFVPTPLAASSGGLDVARRAQAGRRFDPGAAGALLAPGAAAESLARLSAGALVVTTGQQAGLFGGPLFTIHKALTAAALAEALTARWGESVVPVFWVAGDDHDFAEINHCDILAADSGVVRVVLRERDAAAPMLPVFRETVGPDGARARGAVLDVLPPGPFRDEVQERLERSYRPDVSLAEAHAQLMAGLLAPYGVVVARGWHGALKRSARGVFLDAARGAEALDQELTAQALEMRGRGEEPPVTVGEGLSLLMLEGALGRDRLKIAGPGQFTLRRSGESVTLDVIEQILDESPERLSGNVLLRPAVEAAVFPTVGYVGGPGELAYLAQTGPVFARLAVPRPARVPRLSGLLIEAKVDKVLEKYALAPGDLAADEGALASRLARQELPAGAVAALAALREAMMGCYADLQGEAVAVERTLEKTVENARNQALVGVNEVEKRIVAALRRNSETVVRQVTRARGQLFPGGRPQERVLSGLSFVARHGSAVLDLLAEAARAHVRAVLEAPQARA